MKLNHLCSPSETLVQFISHQYWINPEPNQSPGRIEFHRFTHFNSKTGKWSSPEAKARYVRMIELQQQSTEEGKTSMTEDQICDVVLGTRSGYIKGLGYGPRPPPSSSRSRRETACEARDVEQYVHLIESQQIELESQRQEIETLKAKTKDLEVVQSKVRMLEEMM